MPVVRRVHKGPRLPGAPATEKMQQVCEVDKPIVYRKLHVKFSVFSFYNT